MYSLCAKPFTVLAVTKISPLSQGVNTLIRWITYTNKT